PGTIDVAGGHAQSPCLCRRVAPGRAQREPHPRLSCRQIRSVPSRTACTAVYLADKYDQYYPEMQPRLNKGLVAAGAILHDIGKLREIEEHPQGAEYTAAGNLIGHILQGRDIVREAASGRSIDPDLLL